MSIVQTATAAQQKLDFMTLMIKELQYQNPLEPMDNQQMASQLAQFTQLELSENMNGNIDNMNKTMGGLNQSFEGAMFMASLNFAKSLLGQEISFYSEANGQIIQGDVKKVSFVNNQPVLTVNGTVKHNDGSESKSDFQVSLDAIEGIHN